MPNPSTNACDVACAHVAEALDQWGRRAVVYDDVSFEAVGELRDSLWWGRGSQPGDTLSAPPHELLAQYRALGGVSAVATCPSVTALLEARNIPYGATAVTAALQGGGGGDRAFRAAILGVTQPAVSDDGLDALIEWSVQAGPLAGRGNIVWLKRGEDGIWRQHSAATLYIS